MAYVVMAYVGCGLCGLWLCQGAAEVTQPRDQWPRKLPGNMKWVKLPGNHGMGQMVFNEHTDMIIHRGNTAACNKASIVTACIVMAGELPATRRRRERRRAAPTHSRSQGSSCCGEESFAIPAILPV